MIIYNVTIKVSAPIADAWVKWMQEMHIPAVMKSGCFTTHQFVKLLDVDDSEGPTYATQYYAANQEAIDEYIHQFAPALRQDSFDQWGDQFIAFRTLMEVVQ